MTENAAIEYLKVLKEDYFQPKRISEALDTVVESLEEVQKYRALGKIEFLTDMKNHYVEVLSDLRQYQKIGTVEECREAKENKWIPCSERLPEEHDSIFSKLKGTDKWDYAMFEKVSDDVNATAEFEDRQRKTMTLHTIDGKWKTDRIVKFKVIAWQQLPEPYKEGEKN